MLIFEYLSQKHPQRNNLMRNKLNLAYWHGYSQIALVVIWLPQWACMEVGFLCALAFVVWGCLVCAFLGLLYLDM